MSAKETDKKFYHKTSFRITAGILVVAMVLTMVIQTQTLVAITRSADQTHAAVNYLADNTEYVNKSTPLRVLDYLDTLGSAESLKEYYTLASTQIAREEFAAALTNVEKCIALYNNEGEEIYLDLLLKRGCLQVMLGDYDAALKSLDLALAEDPTAADIYLVKAQIYSERQNMDALADCLTHYLELVPEDNSIRELLAQARFTGEDYAAASEQYEEILASGSNTEIEYLYGLNAVKHADYETGEKYLTSAIEKDDSFDGIYYYRGICRMSLQNYPGAIEDLTVSIAQEDMQQASYYTRGVCLLLNNEYEKGLTDVFEAAYRNDDPEITQQAKLLIAELTVAQSEMTAASGEPAQPVEIEQPLIIVEPEMQQNLEQP